jgi:hypothetical protein
MKTALVERLDDLAAVARRLQHVLDAERPDVPFPPSFCAR